ncbi:hypothetical protein C0993_006174, partial [Termitomyces sp. T159_Od127]
AGLPPLTALPPGKAMTASSCPPLSTSDTPVPAVSLQAAMTITSKCGKSILQNRVKKIEGCFLEQMLMKVLL